MGKHRKNSNRLQDYDYSLAGAYFVTLVAKGREPIFGRMVGESIELSPSGMIVQEEWTRTAELRPDVILDEYVIMPDHFHAILIFQGTNYSTDSLGAHRGAPLRRPVRSLGSLVAGFKSKCSQRAGRTLWQRNYHDRVIRDEDELNRIREYVRYNPLLLSQLNEELFAKGKENLLGGA